MNEQRLPFENADLLFIKANVKNKEVAGTVKYHAKSRMIYIDSKPAYIENQIVSSALIVNKKGTTSFVLLRVLAYSR